MTKETEMPDEILAWINEDGTHWAPTYALFGNNKQAMVRYTRTDIHQALLAENKALREALEEIADQTQLEFDMSHTKFDKTVMRARQALGGGDDKVPPDVGN